MSGREERVVTVIGAGTIGLGWIALFLGHGLNVRVNSRREDAPRIVAEGLELFAPYLPEGSADPAGFAERLTFEPDLELAVADADVIVENAPENLELKQELYERIGKAAPSSALLLSSTSTLNPDDMGARMADSSRLVVGHPFNPPHVVPLVEVVAGERTSEQAVAEAVTFFESVGRVPVVLHKPILAFAANRLQSALLRESVHLVREGVVTLEELDRVVTHSIGLRWATVGPFLAFHLGGGQGGLRKWLGTLGSGLERGWEQLGRPPMDDETIRSLIEQAEAAYGSKTYEEHVKDRDAKQTAILRSLAEVNGRP
ncbi:3-hydroxyacyl-CoA dehydrogenase NAD-binding domain-containing protein [Streptomyces lavendulae]|uniref:L-carnitine dehydrogenase n=2 Tax=Streptomycetaceae TaxID=2062 RepID=A0A2K8PVD7_STRLA|nr:3-hydroxyacyl-CoA dehydrogenase NAD-binding domain-containing protein [Streptomyces lavendulae]ACK77759.1 putative 3-hydroxyacyl-CoA dehydrogenase [Streptomyces lavendulae subsp. lavendulae]ATZ29783.1 L-carnitine dehydrogenase [Streptomyces lavendulae subsp. lavendulae]